MVDPRALEITSSTRVVTDQGLVIVIRLRNTSRQALHYISDVRAIKYDPVARRLEVRLTDEGRAVIPGAAHVLPQFRVLDPLAAAELSLTLPVEIIMLAPPPDPEKKKIAFQKHRIADAERIDVVVAWSDTPYDQDPRDTDDQRLPAARWQQNEARVVLSR